jgi:hypothetical protein
MLPDVPTEQRDNALDGWALRVRFLGLALNDVSFSFRELVLPSRRYRRPWGVGLGSGGAGAACARCVETAGAFRRAVIGVRMLQCFVLSLWGTAQAVSLPRTFYENIPYVEVSM